MKSKLLLAFNILAGGIVFIFMLILSFTHTAEFFARGGYHGDLAKVGVIGCELLFFLSNTNIIILKLKGYKVPLPIRIASIVSASIVGYSNISSGFSHGLESVAIGGLILVVLIVSELVVSSAIISVREGANNASNDNIESNKDSTTDTKTEQHNTTESTNRFTNHSNDNSTNNSATGTNTNLATNSTTDSTTETAGENTSTTTNEDNATSATADSTTEEKNTADNSATADDNTTSTTKNNADKVVNMAERKQRRKRELDHETVKAIFLAEGSNAAIGRKFGVNAETVRRIKLGLRHAEITAPLRNAK